MPRESSGKDTRWVLAASVDEREERVELSANGPPQNVGARDAYVLAGICVSPDKARSRGHQLRHAALLRLLGVRRSMRRLEEYGYLNPGWTVDYNGAHCQVTEPGIQLARTVAVAVSLAPDEGPLSNAAIVIRLILNLKFQP